MTITDIFMNRIAVRSVLLVFVLITSICMIDFDVKYYWALDYVNNQYGKIITSYLAAIVAFTLFAVLSFLMNLGFVITQLSSSSLSGQFMVFRMVTDIIVALCLEVCNGCVWNLAVDSYTSAKVFGFLCIPLYILVITHDVLDYRSIEGQQTTTKVAMSTVSPASQARNTNWPPSSRA